MAEISATEARKDFARIVDAAYAKSERVVLTRNGRPVAAVVPIEDLEALEAYEEELDVRAVKQALDEQADEPPRPWAEVKAELGLG